MVTTAATNTTLLAGGYIHGILAILARPEGARRGAAPPAGDRRPVAVWFNPEWRAAAFSLHGWMADAEDVGALLTGWSSRARGSAAR